ncbi:MAG: SDR family oxidoreductase, partial [Nanoarchaeota archaeon]|nr:SDR family oxidoreductase [Nanoarchaeota archaeon]
VHSIAFTKKEDLMGRFIDTPRSHYHLAQDISAYSLIEICRRGEKVLKNNSSIITMTFQGSERVVPNYNIMGVCKASLETNVMYLAKDLGKKGIRINAISSGTIKTRAASAIKGFNLLLDNFKNFSFTKKNVKPEDIANTSLFLLSNLSENITGEIIHVDGGFNKSIGIHEK